MDVAAQVAAARKGALVVPARSHAVMVVTGADRATWLNGLVTCDLVKSRSGDAVYGLAVAQKGRILADLIFVIDPSRVLVVVPKTELEGLRAAFEKYLIMEDAEMGEGAGPFLTYAVHGPSSVAVLEAARSAGAIGGALDLTGLGGAVILAPEELDGTIREQMAALGALGDDLGWEALRLECGLPRFGVDFDGTMYPQEASLERRAVAFDKGCYLGQEVVCMLEMRGHVKRKIVSLVVSGHDVPRKGDAVVTDTGESVGEITSAAASPTLGVPIALAMVKFSAAKEGALLRSGSQTAKIVSRPVA
jgi:folate-binding protein YgfZ